MRRPEWPQCKPRSAACHAPAAVKVREHRPALQLAGVVQAAGVLSQWAIPHSGTVRRTAHGHAPRARRSSEVRRGLTHSAPRACLRFRVTESKDTNVHRVCFWCLGSSSSVWPPPRVLNGSEYYGRTWCVR